MALPRFLSAVSPRRLAVRAFLFGLLVVASFLGTFSAVGALLAKVRGTEDDAPVLHALRALDSPEALTAHGPDIVRSLPRSRAFQLTLFALDGSLLASSTEPPLRPKLPLSATLPLEVSITSESPRGVQVVYALAHEGKPLGYAVSEQQYSDRVLPWFLALAVAGLTLVLTFVSIGLAWTLNRPLQRLTATARAVGEGDFSQRTGLTGQDEIFQVGRAFDAMTEKLEALFHAEHELLAGASHELRTPLARMMVALDLAELGDAPRTARALGEARRSVQDLQAIVDDLLTVTRLELGQGFAPKQSCTDVAALLAEAIDRARERHPGRAIEHAGTGPLGEALLDARLFQRALANLLDNAVKYSDAAITLRAEPSAGGSRLTIEDQGIGMTPEDLQKLFTPFFRADSSRTASSGGVGLGLLLVKRIVEANGGVISVESQPGRGTRVSIDLPRASSAAA